MHLQPKGNTNSRDRFHVPAGIGKALLLTGVVEEVPVVKPGTDYDPKLAVRWIALQGSSSGVYPPILRAICPQCKAEAWSDPESGTAHKTMVLRHTALCGYSGEACVSLPEDVKATYLTLFKQWKERQGRRTRRDKDAF